MQEQITETVPQTLAFQLRSGTETPPAFSPTEGPTGVIASTETVNHPTI